MTVISSSMPDDVGIPKRLQKASVGFIPTPKGKRSLYYMSITKEAHTKMRKDGESDEYLKSNSLLNDPGSLIFCCQRRQLFKGQMVSRRG